MCGRYSLTKAEELSSFFEIDERPEILPRYNIAPTQDALVVRQDRMGRRRLIRMMWGLVPHWAKQPQPGRHINARSETAAVRPAFRDPFRWRRCLVPADGFYEWKHQNGRKQPYHFRLPDGGLFAFAGLWDRWKDRAKTLHSFTILTTDANQVVRPIHDRMPVILPPRAYPLWLDAAAGPDDVSDLLEPFAETLVSVAVSTLVNSPNNDGPECWEPPREEQPRLF